MNNLIINFLPILTILFAGAIVNSKLYYFLNLFSHSIFSVFGIKRYNSVTLSYFTTLMLFAFINLLYSVLGLTNFINYNGSYIYFYIISVVHVILFSVIGLYRKGLTGFFSSFYINCGSSVLFIPINLMVFTFNLSSTLFIEPLVIATRLVISDNMNIFFHDWLHGIAYGSIALVFLTIFKILMCFIQSYVYILLMQNVSNHLYLDH